MESRDALNYLGQKVGTIEFPDDTPESVWEKALAVYSAPPPPEVFPALSPRQIRLALVGAGITMEMVNAALDSLPEPMRLQAQITWEYSEEFERTNPLVDSVATMLTWTTEQVDELWRQASAI